MKKNVILGSIVLVLLLSQIGTFIWNRTLRDKLHIAEQNVTVALDSIRTLKDTNGKLYAEKNPISQL